MTRPLRETRCTPAQTGVSSARQKTASVEPVRFSASLMCADLLNLEAHVRRLEAMGIHYLHFDLMDAHFTPNMPMGLAVLEQVCERTRLPSDVHLMVVNILVLHTIGDIRYEQVGDRTVNGILHTLRRAGSVLPGETVAKVMLLPHA